MPNTSVSLIGNLTSDPDLRVLNSGREVVNFSLAVNDGSKENPHTSYYDVQAWGELAVNASGTLAKGNRAIVVGTLKHSTWETEKGRGSKVEVVAEGVGPDLRFATADVHRTENRETPRDNTAQRRGMQTARDALARVNEQIPGLQDVTVQGGYNDRPF
jgi:single-strand DNA-binding protein